MKFFGSNGYIDLRNLPQLPQPRKYFSDRLVTIFISRPSHLPRFRHAESRRPRSLEDPVLIRPRRGIKSCFCLWHTGTIANLIPDTPLVFGPIVETEFLLHLAFLWRRFVEPLVA